MSVRILRGIDSLGRTYVSRKKDRPCAHCGGHIARRGASAKFCCRACYGAAIKGQPVPAEIVAARRYLIGDKNPAWTGDCVSEKGGRKRALRMYPHIGSCVRCRAPEAERHHKDGNTANNTPENIEALCRRCHMEEDGRLQALRAKPGQGCESCR